MLEISQLDQVFYILKRNNSCKELLQKPHFMIRFSTHQLIRGMLKNKNQKLF